MTSAEVVPKHDSSDDDDYWHKFHDCLSKSVRCVRITLSSSHRLTISRLIPASNFAHEPLNEAVVRDVHVRVTTKQYVAVVHPEWQSR